MPRPDFRKYECEGDAVSVIDTAANALGPTIPVGTALLLLA
jgi:hypothetical protein